jgi:hypothetical protein
LASSSSFEGGSCRVGYIEVVLVNFDALREEMSTSKGNAKGKLDHAVKRADNSNDQAGFGWSVFLIAISVRAALFVWGFYDVFGHRKEIVTPITDFNRGKNHNYQKPLSSLHQKVISSFVGFSNCPYCVK